MTHKWLLATQNQGKLAELRQLLSVYDIQVIPVSAEKQVEETGWTFKENALLKAKAYSHQGLTVLADDSGLMIEALGGQPGVYSARWAGPDQDYAALFSLLQDQLKGTSRPRAAFFCVLCLLQPQKEPKFYEGKLEGVLTFPPQGDHGFGYDPIFIPQGYNVTMAQMTAEKKAKISHRHQAIQRMMEDVAVDHGRHLR